MAIDDVYAHDFDSNPRCELQLEIAKFQRILRRVYRLGRLSRSRSKILNALNPFNYVSMGMVLNLAASPGTSGTRFCRVAEGSYPPAAPEVPGVPDSGTRLLGQ